MSENVLDQEKLDNILSGLPFTLNEKQLIPYSDNKSKYFGEVHFKYLMLGVKSINKYYTKTFWGVCLVCMSKGKTLEEAAVFGQYPQFKKRGVCRCSKINTPEYTHSKENVTEILKGLPKISLVGFGEDLKLNCIDHGQFTHSRLSVVSRKLKHCCPTCILNVKKKDKQDSYPVKASMWYPKKYHHPFSSTDLEFCVGNSFHMSKGNILKVVKYRKDVIDVLCDTCGEVKTVWKTNLKQGQIPCSCRRKKFVVGSVVETKHGNKLTIIKESGKHFYVSCNVCSLDKELWGEPTKVGRGVVYAKGSPCSCSGSCLYTREQYIIKSTRKLNSFSCRGSIVEMPFKFNQKATATFRCHDTDKEYTTGLSKFVRDVDKCPICHPNNSRGFDKSKVGNLYFLYFKSKNDESHFMKVGITNGRVSARFNDIMRGTRGYVGSIMYAFELSSGYSCAEIEKLFKSLYCNPNDRPLRVRFKDGFTEAFSYSLDTGMLLHNDLVGYLGVDITSDYQGTLDLVDFDGSIRVLDEKEY